MCSSYELVYEYLLLSIIQKLVIIKISYPTNRVVTTAANAPPSNGPTTGIQA